MKAFRNLALWLAFVIGCFLPVSAFPFSVSGNHTSEILGTRHDVATASEVLTQAGIIMATDGLGELGGGGLVAEEGAAMGGVEEAETTAAGGARSVAAAEEGGTSMAAVRGEAAAEAIPAAMERAEAVTGGGAFETTSASITGSSARENAALSQNFLPYRAGTLYSRETFENDLGTTVTPSIRNAGAAESEIPTIGGRLPINSSYAGGIHPSGVEFTPQGFPDFSPYSEVEVNLEGLTGDYKADSTLANQAAGYPSTPQGYVWHHVEDGETMQLVPQEIHQAVRHTGGAAVIRNGGFDP